MMRMVAALCAVLCLTITTATAQTNDNALQANLPVEGTISDDAPTLSWRFYGWQDQMLSFRVRAVSPTLDPVLTIRNADGQRIIGNDDYNYPDSGDSLVEGITIPRSGEYEVIVSSFGDTVGDFVLTMIPGYATFLLDERFVAIGDWTPHNLASHRVQDGVAMLAADGVAQTGLLVNPQLALGERYYIEVLVDAVSARNDWALGLALRYRNVGNYIALALSERGEWRLVHVDDGEERIVRDWTPHPAISAGETAFRLGALVDGDTVSVFYDGLFAGRVSDVPPVEGGAAGILTRTAEAVGSVVEAEIDDLFITVPTRIESGYVFPTELIAASPRITAQELVRRGVMPSGGQMAWEIEDSFLDNRTPGVAHLPLVADTRLTDFALGATVQMTFTREEGVAGCGLLFGYQSETDYWMAYLDNEGGYGLSRRVDDSFDNGDGFFAVRDGWDVTATSDLILVVRDAHAHLYINRQHAASWDVAESGGAVGNVAVNFGSSVISCQFRNVWAWRLDTAD